MSDDQVSILMVDDDPANLVALEAMLEGTRQNLVKASSGNEALRRVLEGDFAVILLDVQMPGTGGIETADLIRQREQSRHIPIIFLTGAVRTSEMIFRGYSTGAVDYLMKPVEPDILRAKVGVFVELAVARKKLQREMSEREKFATEVSHLNLELEKKNGELLEANADLEAFSYSVSHDLRTPLRHISGYADVLEESVSGKLDETEARYLSVIRSSAVHMNDLIDDLLELSRIGRSSMNMDGVEMKDLVAEVVERLSPDLEGRSVEWNIGDLPKVKGDGNLLRHVWTNLVSNAVKYTRPRAPARIEIGSSRQGCEQVFFVKDNGVGFDMSHAGKLFGAFQRMHRSDEFEGTGVGLANVRRIVQKHNGRTWAESEEGKGSTFSFSIPFSEIE